MFNNIANFKLISSERREYECKSDPFLRSNDGILTWKDIPKIYQRSLESFSFDVTYINQLSFNGADADYIRSYFESYAPNGDLTIVVTIKHPRKKNEEEILDYEGAFDMGFIEDFGDEINVKTKEGGLRQIISAQNNEKFELDRQTDINGNSITELEYQNIKWDGRRIFNESLLENREGFNLSETFVNPISLNLNVSYESDENIQPVLNVPDIEGRSNFLGFSTSGGVFFEQYQLFYFNSDRLRENVRVTFSFRGQITTTQLGGTRNFDFFVSNDFTYNGEFNQYDTSFNRSILIKRITIEDGDSTTVNIDFTETIVLNIEKDGHLGFFLDFPRVIGNGSWNINYKEKDFSIKVEEDSEFPGSLFNTLTLAQAKDRNLEILTGRKGVLYSDLLTTGTWKDLCVSSGKMIRNLSKLNEDRVPTETPETITTSFKDLLSVKGYLATGHGVEVHNGEERFVIEDLRHFFRENETIQLGEITDYKESAANEFYFVSGEFGNENAGDYEEQQGRYETNAMNTYGMPTTKVTEVFDGKSKLRSDLLGAEQARRKNVTVASTEDTPYDRENFLFDCTTRGIVGYRTIKTWQQLLSARPKYVYDPDSAGNFRLTPLRSLIRWGWFLRTSLWKFGSEFIRYRSSTGFPDMVMQFPGEPERAENGEISVNDLDRELFDAKIIECSVPLNFEMYQQITGSFKDGARSVPNLYGKCVYTYQGSEPQKGWIIKAEIASVTKLTILKAR